VAKATKKTGKPRAKRTSPKKDAPAFSGEYLALGVAIGVALGAALDNLGAGIAIGVAIGVAMGSTMPAKMK
jgi:zinc transporter ZupT